MKNISAKEIYTDMNDTLGADRIGYSTVTKYLRKKILEIDACHGFRADK
jgi:hypothetical protein